MVLAQMSLVPLKVDKKAHGSERCYIPHTDVTMSEVVFLTLVPRPFKKKNQSAEGKSRFSKNLFGKATSICRRRYGRKPFKCPVEVWHAVKATLFRYKGNVLFLFL
jgi:hypothetical protein